MDKSLLEAARKSLHSAERVLILSHIRADGDAIGSLLGLGLALKAIGQEVTMVLPDGVPSKFRHLAGSEQIQKIPRGNFDRIVIVDCSDTKRLDDALNGYAQPDINIDHHPTNLKFAHFNLVDPQAVATAEMLAEYLPIWGLPITSPVANALIYGILTDTLGFRTHNMTPKAMRLTANLMEAGGDLPELYQRGLLNRSYEAAKYWGAGLTELERHGNMIWTSLTLADRRRVGYPGNDDADLINVLTSIDDIDVVMIFVEQNNGYVKVSWRSQPGFDVARVALQFGGGGHTAASGADIKGSLIDVKTQVIDVTRQLLGLN